MNETFFQFPESNPFSTRYTAPGKTPYFFERSFLRQMKAAHPEKFEELFVRALGAREEIRTLVCVHFLVDAFESRGCRGQIVGGHGTGKSTLLHVIKEALISSGYEVFSWSLHDQQRFLPDVFWLELQEFLQSAPNFLPTKCLLPPPVVSHDDYVAQQVESLREVFGDEQVDLMTPNQEEVEEFVVSDEALSEASEKLEEPEPEPPPQITPAQLTGFFGYNGAGNFGLNRCGTETPPVTPQGGAGDFAPFPGIAEPNEQIAESESDEQYDEIVLDSDGSKPALTAQQKLAIPLSADFDLQKSRSFFDKKVVCFDGFEQLSYVNRIILRTFCRMNRLGLLITTHSPVIGIPVLFKTVPSVETLRQLLSFLLDDLDMTPGDAELETLLKNFNYNVRDILFSLYDAFEKYRWAPREIRERIVRRYPR
ncbi:MAG: hypothetical protein PHO46_07990 [Thermoguttaceae bacterium]|nr:hypothetical protein [Thermoguttaceae bacterium]